MVSLYSQHLHSCYLYLGAILVDVFGANCHCIKGLYILLPFLVLEYRHMLLLCVSFPTMVFCIL